MDGNLNRCPLPHTGHRVLLGGAPLEGGACVPMYEEVGAGVHGNAAGDESVRRCCQIVECKESCGAKGQLETAVCED